MYCEVPFSCKIQNGANPAIIRGVIDLIYRKGDDWHIIDYKTNADGNNLDEEYKDQLSIYKRAFKIISGNDADAAIYHIDI